MVGKKISSKELLEKQKKLKIMIGSCKRSMKEFLSYYKELEQEKKRLEEMRSDEKTSQSRIKQQQQVVDESANMIPFTKNKVEQYMNKLKSFLESMVSKEDLEKQFNDDDEIVNAVQLEEYKEATETIKEAERVLSDK